MKRQAVVTLLISLAAVMLVLGSVAALRLWVLNPFRVPTVSMVPAIQNGDIVWIYRLAYLNPAEIHRGDVIAYHLVLNGQPETLLKRVIGIPGDRIRTGPRSVSLNGNEIPQVALREDEGLSIFRETIGNVSYEVGLRLTKPTHGPAPQVNVVVPPAHFFVMGDNRMDALDSRYVGFVTFADVVGKKL